MSLFQKPGARQGNGERERRRAPGYWLNSYSTYVLRSIHLKVYFCLSRYCYVARCREGFFSETRLPLNTILGNSEGVWAGTEPGLKSPGSHTVGAARSAPFVQHLCLLPDALVFELVLTAAAPVACGLTGS